MLPDWFWQGLATNWLSALVVFLMGGAAFWAKLKSHPLLAPALHALAAMALTAVLIFALNVQHDFSETRASRTTTDNIEQRIRDWLDSFGMTVRRRTDTVSTEFFRYVVTMRNGNNVEVVRARERDHYIVLTSSLVFTDIPTFPAQEQMRLARLIELELARASVNFTATNQFSTWMMEKRIPITATLSENELISSVDALDAAMVTARTIAQSAPARVPSGRTLPVPAHQ